MSIFTLLWEYIDLINMVINIVIFTLVAMLLKKLKKQHKELEYMGNAINDQEQALNAGITELKTSIIAANQRVLDKLEDMQTNHPDLTDEIQEIAGMTSAVNEICKVEDVPVEEDPGNGGGEPNPEPVEEQES